MIEILAPLGRTAVIASLPGSPSPFQDEQGNVMPDLYNTPVIPDLNPVLVGLAGSKAYAGHWSETPAYGDKRASWSRRCALLIRHLRSNHWESPMWSTQTLKLNRRPPRRNPGGRRDVCADKALASSDGEWPSDRGCISFDLRTTGLVDDETSNDRPA